MLYRIALLITIGWLTASLTSCNKAWQMTYESPDVALGNYPTQPQVMQGNFWRTLSHNFSLSHDLDRAEVQAQIRSLQRRQNHLKNATAEAAPYIYYVYQQLKDQGLPGELALIPLHESSYNPLAHATSGASGLWQIMPGTASKLGVKVNWWYDGRKDIIGSTKAAIEYFKYLHGRFNGDWLLAIAAYDSGEGTVLNAMRYNSSHGRPVDFWHLPLPVETRKYIPCLLAFAAIIADPGHYGINLPLVYNSPYLGKVDVGSQIDFATAAKLAGLNVATLRKLNPGFKRWATDPSGPHVLLLPTDKIPSFKIKLASLPVAERVTWQHYAIRSGDTLSTVAKKFGTNVAMLQKLNGLKNGQFLHINQSLIIPNNGSIKEYELANNNSHTSGHVHKEVASTKEIKHYAVKKGDALDKIAKRYHVKVADLYKWNNLTHSSLLHPGQRLLIYTE